MWATRSAIVLCLLAVAAPASAASKAELETRIQQLERKLDNRGLLGLLEQVEALQREVQQLRGEIEVQNHDLENLKKRQRDLYLDIDRRLHRLEAGGTKSQLPLAPAQLPVPAQPGVATAPASAPAATAPAGTLDPAEERKAYDHGLEILKEGRYAEASIAFEGFLKKYPQSSYADNAQYWLGEVFYVTRKFEPALDEFGKVLSQYPDSGKVADARLKMGYIQYELKDWAQAREHLEKVVKSYPASTAARLAQERLDRMTREGH